MSVVLAVDGGGFKTHLALVDGDGALLALVRGPGSSPHHIGVEGCVELLDRLAGDAAERAGRGRDGTPIADVGRVLLAGVDLPQEERELQEAVDARGWATRTEVANDTFAVLRAGTERGWGIALVCGSGMNCLGVGPDGRQIRFPALGMISGDWGGGYDVGIAGLAAAARSEDGRGPRTVLEQVVPAHFGLDTPRAVAEAIHLDGLQRPRLAELAPVVLREAASDGVAAGIAERLVSESIAFVRVALERLELLRQPTDVVLGGGLFDGDGSALVPRIADRLGSVAPLAEVRMTDAPPIVGAALLGLDELGAGEEARSRVRRELRDAVGGEALVDG
jgi:N-acetylglucosamine kinase-like BadF-type ATPase